MERSLKTPVIDFHTHVGRWGRRGGTDDIDNFVRNMDAAGVDRACVNSIFYSDARRGNDIVASFVARRPDRFIGVAFVTPHYPDEAIRELERGFDVLGMRYLKLYPDFFGRPHDDPAYAPILEWANERGLVLMCHATYRFDDDSVTIPRRYAALTRRYPHITWVIAHAGGGLSQEAVEATHLFPNVYLETCGSGTIHGGIEFGVEHAGADRLLYGSDYVQFDMRGQVGKIVTADIPEDAKRKILGLNAIELLGLEA